MADKTDRNISLVKLIPEKVWEKAYEDSLKKSAQQLGALSEDAIKTVRLILAPIHLLGAMQDRLESWVEKIRTKVPVERQIQAPPEIAGPVIERLKYTTNDSPLQDMYLNLLARAIDKDRQDEAHPAFVRIIEQLSTDEAILMATFYHHSGAIYFSGKDIDSHAFTLAPQQEQRRVILTDKNLLFPSRIGVYGAHLESLNLVSLQGGPLSNYATFIAVTAFGELFGSACIPKS